MHKIINDLPIIDRPREKLLKYGPEKLSDSELMANILRTGQKGENAIELSTRVLKVVSQKGYSQIKYNDFANLSGLGPTKTSQIISCIELGKRYFTNKKFQIYMGPEDVWKELKDIAAMKKEHFIVLYLDSRNQEIKREIVSIGTLNSSLVHPREVFESAVKNLAASIMLAHNHPSNNPNPSEADIDITKRLIKCGRILGIEVLDHVIVSKDGYFSFKDHALM